MEQSSVHAAAHPASSAVRVGIVRAGVGAGVALSLILLLPPLFARSLWMPDEARYAEVARAMHASGAYWTMRLNTKHYAEKPPLFFWLANVVYALRGAPTDRATRWVSAGATFLTCLLVAVFATSVFGATSAFFSIAVMLTALYAAFLGQLGNLDSLLMLFTTAAVLCLWQAEAGAPDKRGLWLLGAYVLVGLAVLTKGPVGYLVPAIAALSIRWQRLGWRRLPAWHFLWGLGLSAAMIALWLAPASMAEGPGFLWRMLFTQNLGRTVHSFRHAEPFYFYVLHFPLDFLPWAFWLPGAFLFAWRREGEQRLAARSFLWWFLGGFLFFSILSGKRARYLLVLYPVAAMLLGAYLAARIEAESDQGGQAQGRLGRLANGAALAAASLMTCVPAAIVLLTLVPHLPQRLGFVSLAAKLAPFMENLDRTDVLLAVVWGGAAIVALRHGWRSYGRDSLRGVVTGVLAAASLAVLFVPWTVYHNGLPAQPLPELRRSLHETRGAGVLWLYQSDLNGVVNLATRRAPLQVVSSGPELDQAIERKTPFRLVMRTKTFLRLPAAEREKFIEMARVGTKKRGLSIVVPRPKDERREDTVE